jgi:lysocardiolipin and lysophospholipid acyltransferase
VYDITIGYPGTTTFPKRICFSDTIPQSESALFNGQLPLEVHFHVKRYDIKDIPKEAKQLSDWCIDRWNVKEKLLKDFYREKRFPNTQTKDKRFHFSNFI